MQLTVPQVYKRGKGVLDEIGSYCKSKGQRVLVIGGKTALEITQSSVIKNLKSMGLEVMVEWYGGECTWRNINRLAKIAEKGVIQMIVGVGGGKALDTAKAVAYQIGIPIITVPTIAATCASFTPLSIIYDDQGIYVENSDNSMCPEAVFVDPVVIVNASEKWLYSGMGDTLAKWYELRATTTGVSHTSWTIGGYQMGRVCYDIIKEFGPEAKNAVVKKEVNDALENVLDAIFYYAGTCSILGGDKFRGAAAHSVYMGFTKIPELHHFGHGLLVGFGNLCLLALENRPLEEIKREIQLARDCGIPTRLEDIWKFTEEEIGMVAEFALGTNGIRNMPMKISPEMLERAIRYIDKLSTNV